MSKKAINVIVLADALAECEKILRAGNSPEHEKIKQQAAELRERIARGEVYRKG